MEGRFISKDPIAILGNNYTGKHNIAKNQQLEAMKNSYAYVSNNPINWTDPTGLFKYHGNWCGPNWTGGKVETYSPNHNYQEPVDTLDTYCMMHDICYSQCRKDHPCDKVDRGTCMTQCDRDLANGASFSGNSFSPLWLWMNFNTTPDPGVNAH